MAFEIMRSKHNQTYTGSPLLLETLIQDDRTVETASQLKPFARPSSHPYAYEVISAHDIVVWKQSTFYNFLHPRMIVRSHDTCCEYSFDTNSSGKNLLVIWMILFACLVLFFIAGVLTSNPGQLKHYFAFIKFIGLFGFIAFSFFGFGFYLANRDIKSLKLLVLDIHRKLEMRKEMEIDKTRDTQA